MISALHITNAEAAQAIGDEAISSSLPQGKLFECLGQRGSDGLGFQDIGFSRYPEGERSRSKGKRRRM